MGKSSSQSAFKKKRERLLVREFLAHRGMLYRLSGVRSVTERKTDKGGTITGPDVRITCTIGGKDIRVGVELVEYQVDAAGERGSQGRQFKAFFDKIWLHLRPLLCNRRGLRECFGTLFFDWDQRPDPREAKNIAEELMRFLRDHRTVLANGELHYFLRKEGPGQEGHFDGYPCLKKHFKKIALRNLGTLTGPLLWAYNCAACIGVREDHVLRLIDKKSSKIRSYDLSNVEEVWLLMCAGIALPHDSAGPEHVKPRLFSKAIRDAARNSGFNRVIFWERIHDWHANLL